MEPIKKKIDFELVVAVEGANPNGDPANANRPRCDDERGLISDVCIKRKLRNRMQMLGKEILVKSDNMVDDNFYSLAERAKSKFANFSGSNNQKGTREKEKFACETWLDVRAFGNVFAYQENETLGVTGAVSIQPSRSVDPINIVEIGITKSTNGKSDDKIKTSDRMGNKSFVRFGLYTIKGSINAYLAEKNGLTEDDVETIKECLKTLFVNDATAARPDGSMRIVKMYWWEHSTKEGNMQSYKVFDSVHICKKDGIVCPRNESDYIITRDEIAGVNCEEFSEL